ncbi:hypothetical protein GGQ97_002441 [Sphingomonas kaistensis]|uniref:Uncharacterized protein n=1 Tax=Sphingomonas kaistensis TaxID=298708 RepID=A0A7X5Y8A9_9SPHN|nr:hypothetical protein [Sphingomonas kaistensis]NJC06648.1 hypothetical protein [Sphingomonas kaistensis]
MSILLALFALSAPDPIVVTATPKDPVICERSRASSLGSNISQPRTCKRKSEWDAQARDSRRNLQKVLDRRSDPFKVPGAQPIPQ